ncbi:agamous-like MADS-box protein AGL19 [Spinacia oleracea]|uniref:Agamous-like MADS-box protein AGL19 n=1 Tax=Spinacia oleracea TaxID=3562 RepID=A0A9R0KCG1_SPIOL|nr:agamous-like MADS-box protein AGL19 [Spinacia oleracea]
MAKQIHKRRGPRGNAEMKKIEDKVSLSSSFTKRRNSLFKKANEMTILCEAELTIILFSPGKKVYTFGHPNVYSIIDRFANNLKVSIGEKRVTMLQKSKANDLYDTLNNVQDLVELSKKEKSKEMIILEESKKTLVLDRLNHSQTMEMRGVVKELQARIMWEIHQRIIVENNQLGVEQVGSGNEFINCVKSNSNCEIQGPFLNHWSCSNASYAGSNCFGSYFGIQNEINNHPNASHGRNNDFGPYFGIQNEFINYPSASYFGTQNEFINNRDAPFDGSNNFGPYFGTQNEFINYPNVGSNGFGPYFGFQD